MFSRKRFFQIFWCLHVSHPTSAVDFNLSKQVRTRLSKVKDVLDYLENRFLEYYSQRQNLSADESTVSFKGHVLFKMYNKNKQTKW